MRVPLDESVDGPISEVFIMEDSSHVLFGLNLIHEMIGQFHYISLLLADHWGLDWEVLAECLQDLPSEKTSFERVLGEREGRINETERTDERGSSIRTEFSDEPKLDFKVEPFTKALSYGFPELLGLLTFRSS